MRILCLSDVHRDLAAARRLGAMALAGGIDLVVSGGDLGVDGANDRAVYEALSRSGVPVLSVPGNHDGGSAYGELAGAVGWTDLDGQVIERAGWWFAGFGLPSWDGRSDPAEAPAWPELLARMDAIPIARLVLVSHVPPAGTLTSRDRRFVDRGSPRIAEWIAAWHPAACICGHVHHREPVTDRIGDTSIVNAGPYGYVLVLGGKEQP
ncbi:metallophosphoesterase [Anaeromyxobacter sp. K]|uniref:metallophosphoesterase family protein n=1 Tax=Anaeromyxobacter sp. (strain K) TaxID=447217 RepID=UPI00015F8937|nr:metallophosphoesterase [Anaeromyxobacter sp. K]ACG75174.1 metallophosphoesterase [Anaeromyxobacter sp. K]